MCGWVWKLDINQSSWLLIITGEHPGLPAWVPWGSCRTVRTFVPTIAKHRGSSHKSLGHGASVYPCRRSEHCGKGTDCLCHNGRDYCSGQGSSRSCSVRPWRCLWVVAGIWLWLSQSLLKTESLCSFLSTTQGPPQAGSLSLAKAVLRPWEVLPLTLAWVEALLNPR